MNREKIVELLKKGGSLKLTTWGLIFLLVVVFWGTLFQAGNGLYASQAKFFHSWFFTIFGFLPFPGVLTISLVLFINLILSVIFRMDFSIKNSGNLITHAGIAVLLTGSFISFVNSEHTRLNIKEGTASSKVFHLHKWELAVQTEEKDGLTTRAVDYGALSEGKPLQLKDLNMRIVPRKLIRNSVSIKEMGSTDRKLIEDHSSAVPGATVSVESSDKKDHLITLWGEDRSPATINTGTGTCFLSLRRKVAILPVKVFLKDFVTGFHPNSNIPRSYISKVKVSTPEGNTFDAEISMNKPLRFKDYTLYQSSFFKNRDGEEYSIIAVVKNRGRLIPYISSAIIFVGMALHFILKSLLRRRKND